MKFGKPIFIKDSYSKDLTGFKNPAGLNSY